ncbi:hypothetical protein FNF31_06090 [Cafeteria roenbergensis]|uniref:Response regulatory domain-containing protein n=1 Tax=Cafeteria roenbergensis TaxID=33653 RepID=A0A5A8CUT1_CAFRO|nr:hypothetical protein FNF31_06090 [Cafeteria roenbergensis]
MQRSSARILAKLLGIPTSDIVCLHDGIDIVDRVKQVMERLARHRAEGALPPELSSRQMPPVGAVGGISPSIGDPSVRQQSQPAWAASGKPSGLVVDTAQEAIGIVGGGAFAAQGVSSHASPMNQVVGPGSASSGSRPRRALATDSPAHMRASPQGWSQGFGSVGARSGSPAKRRLGQPDSSSLEPSRAVPTKRTTTRLSALEEDVGGPLSSDRAAPADADAPPAGLAAPATAVGGEAAGGGQEASLSSAAASSPGTLEHPGQSESILALDDDAMDQLPGAHESDANVSDGSLAATYGGLGRARAPFAEREAGAGVRSIGSPSRAQSGVAELTGSGEKKPLHPKGSLQRVASTKSLGHAPLSDGRMSVATGIGLVAHGTRPRSPSDTRPPRRKAAPQGPAAAATERRLPRRLGGGVLADPSAAALPLVLPRLVLTDLQMPTMTGPAAIAEMLRLWPADEPRPYIVCLTGEPARSALLEQASRLVPAACIVEKASAGASQARSLQAALEAAGVECAPPAQGAPSRALAVSARSSPLAQGPV